MSGPSERAAEATRDPIWIVEAREIRLRPEASWKSCCECEGYHRHGNTDCDEAKSATEALSEDSESFYAFWRGSGDAFLSREAAEAWATRRDYHYPEGWRVFCYALPRESKLTPLLRGVMAS